MGFLEDTVDWIENQLGIKKEVDNALWRARIEIKFFENLPLIIGSSLMAFITTQTGRDLFKVGAGLAKDTAPLAAAALI